MSHIHDLAFNSPKRLLLKHQSKWPMWSPFPPRPPRGRKKDGKGSHKTKYNLAWRQTENNQHYSLGKPWQVFIKFTYKQSYWKQNVHIQNVQKQVSYFPWYLKDQTLSVLELQFWFRNTVSTWKQKCCHEKGHGCSLFMHFIFQDSWRLCQPLLEEAETSNCLAAIPILLTDTG